MRAQAILTPAESKKLIAQALPKLPVVQEALALGKVVLHPSSTTYFVLEALTGKAPQIETWVSGVIVPKGACSNIRTHQWMAEHGPMKGGQPSSVEHFPFSWVMMNGKMETGVSLGSILADMGKNDVYIKGVNALDPQGNVGILYGNMNRPGGTFGMVAVAARAKGFKLIFPVGLEKMIPISIKEAAKAAQPKKLDYSMGMPVGLIPCEGTVVTEVDAIRILSGGNAIPIASGGLSGAEGAVLLVIEGDQKQVNTAMEYINLVKGAKLPVLQPRECKGCDRAGCSLRG